MLHLCHRIRYKVSFEADKMRRCKYNPNPCMTPSDITDIANHLTTENHSQKHPLAWRAFPHL